MNRISILFIFLILLLAIVFIVGIIILFVGLLKKDKRNSTTTKGLIFMSIPIGIVAIVILYEFSHDKFTKKPTDKDLVGVYHITDANSLISTNQYHSYTLEFKNDGTFYLTPTPNINVCETGKYFVDWQFKFNELSFQCDKGFTTAHIDRNFSGYRIEFIVGDPDSGESIFFSKEK
jgi:hypothetical protein